MLAWEMKEWMGFGDVVALMVQDLRKESLSSVSHMEDMLDLLEAPFSQRRNHARPSRTAKSLLPW